MVGEHIGQALGRGEMRRVHRRAEQPQLGFGDRGGGGFEDVVFPHQVPGQRDPHPGAAHQRHDVVEVGRERLDVAVVAAGSTAQRHRRHRIRARRATDTQIDASGVSGFEQRELLGHRQRRVVGQHHSARAEPHRRGVGGQVGDQHRRARRGHRGHVVVFGQPVPRVTELVGGLGQQRRRSHRIRGALVGADGDEVENGETHYSVNATQPHPCSR